MTTRNLWILIAVLIGLSMAGALYIRTCCGIQQPPESEQAQRRGLYDPYVSRTEFNCVRCDFKQYFVPKLNGTTATLNGDILMDLNSFNTKLDHVLNNFKDFDDYGIIVHHGLRQEGNNFHYWPEIEIVGLMDAGTDLWDIVRLSGQRFTLHPNTGVLEPEDNLDQWATYKDHMYRYVNSHDALNDPTHARTIPVQEGVDVQHYLFRYKDRLQRHLRQNAGLNPTHILISSIAEPTEHDGDNMRGLRHFVSLAMYKDVGAGIDPILVEDKPHLGARYKMKALDVGSPCPYRCATAEIPDHGVPIRRTCTANQPGC